ncbi:hypothetical protein HMPREF9163_01639 [Selenomonas sp. oral taxon 138 str. F0429]|nr:hypothetical protein HMPREF9163_01639 [Selenomonas sp. oral taxon 138 str. F0429]
MTIFLNDGVAHTAFQETRKAEQCAAGVNEYRRSLRHKFQCRLTYFHLRIVVLCQSLKHRSYAEVMRWGNAAFNLAM